VPEVRVIGADGSQVGIMPTHEALRSPRSRARAGRGQPRAPPPVCAIMDFGKFKYETSKKEKASRKHQSTVVVKEIKLRPRPTTTISTSSSSTSALPGEGNKCKLAIVFRGREIVHPETGQAMLDTVVKAIADIAMVEQRPIMEGRRMVMMVGPRAASSAVPTLPPHGGRRSRWCRWCRRARWCPEWRGWWRWRCWRTAACGRAPASGARAQAARGGCQAAPQELVDIPVATVLRRGTF
jgi:translation initiation factor IF-3